MPKFDAIIGITADNYAQANELVERIVRNYGDVVTSFMVEEVAAEEPADEPEEPNEDDGTITDRTRGGYDVAIDGKFIGHASERDEAEKMLAAWMNENNFYPDCWLISDHGNAVRIDIDLTAS